MEDPAPSNPNELGLYLYTYVNLEDVWLLCVCLKHNCYKNIHHSARKDKPPPPNIPEIELYASIIFKNESVVMVRVSQRVNKNKWHFKFKFMYPVKVSNNRPINKENKKTPLKVKISCGSFYFQ